VHILCDSFVAFVFRREDAANPEHTVARIAWAGGEAIFFRISAHLLAWAVSNIILCLELADGDNSISVIRHDPSGSLGCHAKSFLSST
jgi:hypothetical protein